MQYTHAHFVICEFFQRANNGLNGALNIALQYDGKFFKLRILKLRHHLFQRCAGRFGVCMFAAFPAPEFRNFARARFCINNRKSVAGFRHAIKAKNFNRESRASLCYLGTLIIAQGANLTPFRSDDQDIAAFQGAAFNQQGGYRAATFIEACFHNGTFRRPVRVCF